VLDALPAAVYATDAEGYVTYYNQPAVELAGRRPELGVDQWCVTWRLLTEDGAPLPLEQCPMAIALKEQRPVRGMLALAVRPDGTQIPFMPFPTPLFDENGQLIGAINMLVDITERKKGEETQALLINELNHRVKNTLAVVQALAQQTMRRASSPKQFADSFPAGSMHWPVPTRTSPRRRGKGPSSSSCSKMSCFWALTPTVVSACPVRQFSWNRNRHSISR
jgi:PAS domain S-box-containing protein